jgi:hypothetical protein
VKRGVICGILAVLVPVHSALAAEAISQTGAHRGTSLTLGVLVSFQAEDSTLVGDPYLNAGLAGTRPGLFAAIEHQTAGGAILALALSTTSRMEVSQFGRDVPAESGGPCGPFAESGCGPVVARHRDTLVSMLGGFGRCVAVKAGFSIVLGEPRQGDLAYRDATGRLALTVGVDGAISLGSRATLVPSAFYSRVRRGQNAQALGLGSDILRVGVGVRFRVGG